MYCSLQLSTPKKDLIQVVGRSFPSRDLRVTVEVVRFQIGLYSQLTTLVYLVEANIHTTHGSSNM
jgi:hypothetical protein